MSKNRKRAALLCLDGLSIAQFEEILSMMPRLAASIEVSSLGTLNTHPHSDPHPSWAEILTTECWYKNGCAGYAAARRSLNEITPVYEGDLSCSFKLLDHFCKPVIFNVPLVEPNQKERIWFADAGHPTINTISPGSLMISEPYKSYRSRAVTSMGYALANSSESLESFTAFEQTHLECATTICDESDWDLFIYRTTIFDQLAHLFGAEFVSEKRLVARSTIERIAGKIDEFFASVINQTDKAIVFSTFSHGRCSAIVSVNDFFVAEKLQVRSETDSAVLSLRKKALAAARAEEAGSSSLAVSDTLEFLTSKTIWASPIRGGVYMNVKERFLDGIVEPDRLDADIEQISQRLMSYLSKYCANATVSHNPQKGSAAPHLVLTVPGVELIDSFRLVNTNELPHSTHLSDGFIWISTNAKLDKAKPNELFEVIK